MRAPTSTPQVESDRSIMRQERIMDAATALFVEKGFEGASTAELALRSGLSVAQIYRDFTNKDGLILAIAERVTARFCAAIAADTAIAERDPAAVRAWLYGLLERNFDPAGYGLVPELLATATRDERIRTIISKMDDAVMSRLRAGLRILAPDLPANRIDQVAFEVSSIIVGVSTRWRAVPTLNTPTLLQQAKLSIDYILRQLS